MKKIMCCIIILTSLVLCPVANAQELKHTQIEHNVSNLDSIKFEVISDNLSVDNYDSDICSIAVVSEKYLVVALSNNNILIFNDNDSLCKVFKFYTTGSYYVFSNGDSLFIYLNRGYCYEVTIDGKLVNVISWDNTDCYTATYLREKKKITKVEANEAIYRREHEGISRIMGESGYCKITKEINGERNVVYKAKYVPKLWAIMFLLGLILFFTIPSVILLNVKLSNKRINHNIGDGSIVPRKN